jgi:hypothetical protein
VKDGFGKCFPKQQPKPPSCDSVYCPDYKVCKIFDYKPVCVDKEKKEPCQDFFCDKGSICYVDGGYPKCK